MTEMFKNEKATATMEKELMKALETENWEDFCFYASCPELIEKGFAHLAKVPKEYRYDMVLSCYMHHGNEFEVVRKEVRKLSKFKAAELPPEIASQEEITIYRAGTELKRSAHKRLSWTTDLGVALFFFCRNELNWSEEFTLAPFRRYKPRCHIWKAKIKTKDIIAYLDGRYEEEILQYEKVYDLEELSTLSFFMNPENEALLQKFMEEKRQRNNKVTE